MFNSLVDIGPLLGGWWTWPVVLLIGWPAIIVARFAGHHRIQQAVAVDIGQAPLFGEGGSLWGAPVDLIVAYLQKILDVILKNGNGRLGCADVARHRPGQR